MSKNVGKSFKARNIPLKILLWCQFSLRNCNYHQTENLLQFWKMKFCLKISIFNFFWYFLSIDHKRRLHMCPSKIFDTRWCYNIHKLNQKNYLKFFGLQKNTTVDNNEGGPMDPTSLLSPTEDILEKIT